MKRTDRLGRMGILFGALGFSLFLALPSAAAEKVEFLLNWIPVGYHVGFFVALEKGYYANEGLAVSIERGKGSGDTAKRVGLGSSQVGLSDAGSVVVARAKGLKTKLIGAFFDRNPMAIYVLKSSGIRGPKDLIGRSLAAPLASASRVVFPAFASANGIPLDSVKWVTVPPAAQVPTLVTKRADGIASFLTSRPAYDKAASESGQEIHLIYYADHGLDIYGLTLVSGDSWIQSRSNLAKAFLKASYQGIRWAVENPPEGMKLLLKNHPALDLALASKTWEIAQELIVTPVAKKHGLGHMERAKVELTRDVISKYEKVKGPTAAADLYTNGLLPGIFPPKR